MVAALAQVHLSVIHQGDSALTVKKALRSHAMGRLSNAMECRRKFAQQERIVAAVKASARTKTPAKGGPAIVPTMNFSTQCLADHPLEGCGAWANLVGVAQQT